MSHTQPKTRNNKKKECLSHYSLVYQPIYKRKMVWLMALALKTQQYTIILYHIKYIFLFFL